MVFDREASVIALPQELILPRNNGIGFNGRTIWRSAYVRLWHKADINRIQ